MKNNAFMPTLPPTFMALTPPRRMWPGIAMPRYVPQRAEQHQAQQAQARNR
ncbi:hypothetical protein WG219_21140 [Ectopseudomonas mendocina]|uniref:Uncharacterized protein n=1 Tax=Ectopseudomonas mendocina TaxID=300 RepID=A0ABZ2RIA9_ECTME